MTGLVDDALALLRQANVIAKEVEAALAQVTAGGQLPAHTVAFLAQIRAKAAAAQALHVRVAETLIRIERRQTREASMQMAQAVYWRQSAEGTTQGPYCPQCWEKSNKATLLRNLPFRGHDRWVCGLCQKTFFSDGAKEALDASQRAALSRQPGLQADEE